MICIERICKALELLGEEFNERIDYEKVDNGTFHVTQTITERTARFTYVITVEHGSEIFITVNLIPHVDKDERTLKALYEYLLILNEKVKPVAFILDEETKNIGAYVSFPCAMMVSDVVSDLLSYIDNLSVVLQKYFDSIMKHLEDSDPFSDDN